MSSYWWSRTRPSGSGPSQKCKGECGTSLAARMILGFEFNSRTFLAILSSQSIMSGKTLSAELCFHQSELERQERGRQMASLVLSGETECWVIKRHVASHERSVHLHWALPQVSLGICPRQLSSLDTSKRRILIINLKVTLSSKIL